MGTKFVMTRDEKVLMIPVMKELFKAQDYMHEHNQYNLFINTAIEARATEQTPYAVAHQMYLAQKLDEDMGYENPHLIEARKIFKEVLKLLDKKALEKSLNIRKEFEA